MDSRNTPFLQLLSPFLIFCPQYIYRYQFLLSFPSLILPPSKFITSQFIEPLNLSTIYTLGRSSYPRFFYIIDYWDSEYVVFASVVRARRGRGGEKLRRERAAGDEDGDGDGDGGGETSEMEFWW